MNMIEQIKGNVIDFDRLEEFERQGLIEEYDLFHVLSEHFTNIPMFYSDGVFYIITAKRDKFREIDRDLLRNRKLLYSNNYVKQYIEQYGKDNFNLLTSEELIKVVLGREYNNDLER